MLKHFFKGSRAKKAGNHRLTGNIFVFEIEQWELTTMCISCLCLTLRKYFNIEDVGEKAGRPQQDSSVITATRPGRIGVYCERSIFLVISLPSRLISSTTSPHAASRQSFVLYVSHAQSWWKGKAHHNPCLYSCCENMMYNCALYPVFHYKHMMDQSPVEDHRWKLQFCFGTAKCGSPRPNHCKWVLAHKGRLPRCSASPGPASLHWPLDSPLRASFFHFPMRPGASWLYWSF